MILTKNIKFKNFSKKVNSVKIKKKLKEIINSNSEVLKSLSVQYKYNYSQKFVNQLQKRYKNLNLIGMGGSILGTKAIYNFLKPKVKAKVKFIDNLSVQNNFIKKNSINLIVSKSGNTLETIINAGRIINKSKYNKNIFITENKNSILKNLAIKLRSDIVSHNNFIGGRYSVLSEVGMLPISLMGLSDKKFKKFNNLIKNKIFINNLITNVANIINFTKKKKYNSVIINYDENSEDLFKWYQQLVAESLGKNQFGIFPIISTMPKDNHSLLQLYLDGPKNNFYTFFNVSEKKSSTYKNKINFGNIIRNKSISEILNIKKTATENIFEKKKIPFRSFNITKRNEDVLGELFSFFILETILLAKLLKLNPFNQPAVELIKKETKIILNKF